MYKNYRCYEHSSQEWKGKLIFGLHRKMNFDVSRFILFEFQLNIFNTNVYLDDLDASGFSESFIEPLKKKSDLRQVFNVREKLNMTENKY